VQDLDYRAVGAYGEERFVECQANWQLAFVCVQACCDRLHTSYYTRVGFLWPRDHAVLRWLRLDRLPTCTRGR